MNKHNRKSINLLVIFAALLLLTGCASTNTEWTRVAVTTAKNETLLGVNLRDGKVTQSVSIPANSHGAATAGNRIFVGDISGNGIYFVENFGKADNPDPRFISLGGATHHLASFEDSVFVSLKEKDLIAVLNANTAKLKSKISVPKAYYMVVVPDRNRLYVTSRSTGSVRVIDLETLKVVEKITVGKAPSQLAYDGNRLWVRNKGSGDISVVDLSTNREIKRIQTGADPHGIAYDSKTNRVFVSNRKEGILTVINAGRLERGRTVDLKGAPGHLASANDRILVALRHGGAIKVMNPASLNVERSISINKHPHQMVVMPE